MGASFYSEPQKEAGIKCCCFFKTLGSPLGIKACSVHIAVAICSCLHHTGVCQCEKAPSWTKDWTTVCRQGLLTKTTFQHSAVSPYSLAFCSNIHNSFRSTNRTLVHWPAIHLYLCYHVVEQGDTGIHLCPRCRQAPPKCPTRQVSTQDTQDIKLAQPCVITTCCPSEPGIYNSLQQRREIKPVLASQITNYVSLQASWYINNLHSNSHKVITDILPYEFHWDQQLIS